MDTDLSEVVISAANSLVNPFWKFMWALTALVGFIYCGKTVYAWMKDTQHPGPPQVSTGSKISVFFIGVALVNFAKIMNAGGETLGLGARGFSAISYSSTSNLGSMSKAIDAVLTLAAMFGGYFGFKGLTMLRSASEMSGRGQYAGQLSQKAIVHILGGACLIQIPAFLNACKETLKLTW